MKFHNLKVLKKFWGNLINFRYFPWLVKISFYSVVGSYVSDRSDVKKMHACPYKLFFKSKVFISTNEKSQID